MIHRTIAARTGDPPHPLTLLLHGRGADELDLLGLGPSLDPRCLVISVRAPLPWPGGGYCWYPLDAPGRPELAAFRSSLARLAGFLDDLAGRYPIDAASVYLVGFSQGAVMSHALLRTAPARVAGAALLSGFPPPSEELPSGADGVAGKPVFVTHGRHDAVIDVGLGRRARDELDRLGVDLTYREYDMGHQIADATLADLGAWLQRCLDRDRRP